MILDVAESKTAGTEVVACGICGAGDGAAVELGVTFDVDVGAALTGE